MTIVSFVDESPTKKSITLEVPAEDVRRATERAARSLAKQVRLPGFRPGKVPVDLVKKKFADELKGEVLEHVINDSVTEALRERKLVPLGRPKVEDLKFEADQPVSFRVDLEVRPHVEVKDWRGLKVPSESTAPTEAEVAAVIERLREQHATFEPVEGRPAADGDFALADVKGSFPYGDGKDFSAEKAMIEIGGERTMTEMSGNLRNAEPGAHVSFQKTFAADVPDTDFAGKTVLYNVSLVALKKRVLPPLDDEFAKLVLTPRDGEAPEGASLAMLKEKVMESVARDKEQALVEKKRRAVLDGLLALHDVPAPDVMVGAEIDSALTEYARHLARQGVNLQEAGLDWTKLREEARPAAERRVREYLLLDAVADAEKIEVTDTELDAEIRRRASGLGGSFAEVKAALAKNDRLENLREELRIERAVGLLVEASVTAAA